MANPKKGTSQARNEFIWGWAFILPTMLGLIILKDENGEPISTANHATMLFSLKCERNVSPYAFIRRKRPEAADPLE